jgi:hypothetical protein
MHIILLLSERPSIRLKLIAKHHNVNLFIFLQNLGIKIIK